MVMERIDRAQLLRLLLGRTTLLVLFFLHRTPHTAEGIAASLGLPQATVCRHLWQLQDLGMVTVDPSPGYLSGPPVGVYRSRLQLLELRYGEGDPMLEVRMEYDDPFGSPEYDPTSHCQ